MSATFYFYDLETSGINPRSSRIMQFAGQRTDLNLKPIGPPDNILIKLSEDVLPEPDAILVTGITPQKTVADGMSESDFLRYFYNDIALKDTIFVGFNSIRFDDEFMRFLNYRNFYDAYEWQWQDGRSKWDLLDVSRMTRALRPEGIEWPFASDGKPSNKLELLASINKLDHFHAHDALSDVQATIAVAGLIKNKQGKLFDYLFAMRDKKSIEELVLKSEPFVYSSGRYSSDNLKTTVVVTICNHPSQKGSVFVYDLRYDPAKFVNLSKAELAEKYSDYSLPEEDRLPVKQLQFNRCPAVAPISVLDEKSQKRINIDIKIIKKNLETLLASSDFTNNFLQALQQIEKQKQSNLIPDIKDVDSQLYDGFFDDGDKTKMRVIRAADENGLADLNLDFNDSRLEKLLLLYKGRQYPSSLTPHEQKEWEVYRQQKLIVGGEQSMLSKYFMRLQELYVRPDISDAQRFLLEELKIWGESIMP